MGAISQHARPIQQHSRCTDRPSISVFSPVGNARPFIPERTRTRTRTRRRNRPGLISLERPQAGLVCNAAQQGRPVEWPSDCHCVRFPVMRGSLSAQLHSLNAFMRRLAPVTACDSLRSSHALLTPLGARSTLLVPPWHPNPALPVKHQRQRIPRLPSPDCRLKILLATCLLTRSEAFVDLWPVLADTCPPLPTPSKAAIAPDTVVTTPSKLDLSYHAIGAFCASLPCDASPYLSQQTTYSRVPLPHHGGGSSVCVCVWPDFCLGCSSNMIPESLMVTWRDQHATVSDTPSL
ncbi:hypothetical protein COCSADRAFT_237666 [Bipolaris sorokiniana ND90Pr]|uniref:Uncharacterized protein n=1 Tax=Cochliobolus sativus (strain ND90Pr / ATCC 201652) TaxID=665912 RepID=M2SER8_COCSN|nr:uncharacterized protein COCSADRAFT_237666 [Bipolaris sorokiniana ND90Pr]EMD60955.1 hypothetical protein COCSADRAFT_237666 [Bipolaris sorokiniana ND90Pr]